jgi:uncharacterized OB-fold protein/acyl dehydratase
MIVSDLYEQLQALVGSTSGEATVGPDPVNAPMIRHMVEALGDTNPVYVDDAAAKAAGFDGIVAPATMLQTWSMGGLHRKAPSPEGGWGAALVLLDGAGFTSTVAVNCEQEYIRYLQPGDRVSVTGSLESVSEEKATGLGVGHFVTTKDEYRDQDGELVGTHLFRVLKFKPGTGRNATPAEEDRPLRPRPPTTRDTQWWFDACKEGKLLIQRCTACGTLRHPPGPACPDCHSFEWDTVEASGKGTVYSFVVTHHPQAPAFDYPLPIVLVELEEGTRLVSNLIDVDPDDVEIGMPVIAELVAFDDELTIPQFRAAAPLRKA